ncbi:MAG: hypothetical protein JWQ91_2080 [Aeromicrobium sp.]|jgi:hypothetical protein|nr:hypothetical protein [Aeromicrobium sp.]
MKKILTLGIAAAGVLWALGKAKNDKPADTWAAGTDKL